MSIEIRSGCFKLIHLDSLFQVDSGTFLINLTTSKQLCLDRWLFNPRSSMRFIGRSCDAFQSKRISVVPRPTPIAPQATEVSSVTWRIWEFLTFSSFVLCHRVIKKFDAITVQLHSIYIYIAYRFLQSVHNMKSSTMKQKLGRNIKEKKTNY